MRFALQAFLCLLWGVPFSCYAQNPATGGDSTKNIPASYYNKVGSRAATIDREVTTSSESYLKRLSRTEDRLLRRMQSVDTAAASHLPSPGYARWIDRLHDTAALTRGLGSAYVARLDTLQTTLNFLQRSSGQGSTGNPQLAVASQQVAQLQSHLDEWALISQYISLRRQQLAQYLSQYSSLPSGVVKEFAQYKATAYYYRQQIEGYKKLLNDPQKIEQEVVKQLSKLPVYEQFIARHSLLASVFQLPAGYGTTGALQGLQTRDQIQQQIQQQVSGGGSGGMAAVDQQMQQAQIQLSNIQNSLSKYGAGGQDLDMPNFTPNQQKTKTFLKRLSYGASLQLSKAANFFPATGEVGFTLGYKINDKSTLGVGVAYNIGLGSDWGHINFSSQGLGLRSYMDWKIKKTYYVVGGYELNHLTEFNSIPQLGNTQFWQPSALIGVEKKYKISSKIQGNFQLLFDALYRQEQPAGQMFKFRVGYNF